MKKQPLAHVHFRLSPESVIQLKHVTPAQLMYLIAMHKQNAKGVPVVKLTVINESAEDNEIKSLRGRIQSYEKAIEKIQEELLRGRMPIDVAEEREAALLKQITSVESLIADQERLLAHRALNPVQERTRLSREYNAKDVKAFFPGGIPTLPSTFDEATANGVEAEFQSSADTFYGTRESLVNDPKLAHA